jgi:acylphosphatase
MQRVQVVVSGQVQGVFFRDSCRREARRLGVSGWVRNAADGTVVAEFQGEAAAVDAMVDWCEHGPPHAAVDRVDRSSLTPRDESGFEVR